MRRRFWEKKKSILVAQTSRSSLRTPPRSSKAAATTVARVCLDEGTARRVADALAERFGEDEAAVAASETPDGSWAVELYSVAAPDQEIIRDVVARMAGAAAAGALTIETIEEADWVAASLACLPPVAAGRFSVHGSHDRGRVPANRIAIEIQAALAFGTGHHGTTRACLLALDRGRKRRRPRRVLDLGTGSGVLAIAAAKALHRRVIAGDIDARAAAVARQNAVLNGVAPLVEVVHAAGLRSPRIRARAPFDLVFANILLGPLARLARPMAGLVAPGGQVILSGLLPGEANAALSAYRRCGLVLVRRMALESWMTLVLVRH